jgi:hypothetical protein
MSLTPRPGVGASVIVTTPAGIEIGPVHVPTGIVIALLVKVPMVAVKVKFPETGSVMDDSLQISMKPLAEPSGGGSCAVTEFAARRYVRREMPKILNILCALKVDRK